MKTLKLLSLLFISLLLSQSCTFAQKKLALGDHELYKVYKAEQPIVIDGIMDDSDWQRAEMRTFDHHYLVEKPSDKVETEFRMLWDEDNLYLFYDCKDQYITARETQRDGAPYLDDCAEIFLIPVPDSIDMHFCLEINLNKVSNDIVFLNNMYQGKPMVIKAFNPDFDVEVSINGTVNDNSDIDKGWTMEVAIPITNFIKTDVYQPVEVGSQWAFLGIRQNRDEVDSDRRVISTLYPIYDIEKDVHQPNRFGLLEFAE